MNKTTGGEKFVRIAIFAGLIWGGIKLVNYIAPTLIDLMKNVYWLVGLGVPLAFLTLFIISNQTFLWMQYKRICRGIVSVFVKMDPLSIMKGYLEYLQKKKRNLDTVKVALEGKKIKLGRKMEQLTGEVEKNRRLGQAALKAGDQKQAALYGTYLQGDKQSLDLYRPIYAKLEENDKFLNELSENWGYSIDGLGHEIERKEEEYVNLREMVKALKQASSFAEASEAERLYEESLKALEENVSQKMAYIEDFENKSKDMMKGINTEKNLRTEEGLAALNNLKDEKLLLPADYSVFNKLPSETLSYQPIKKKTGLLD